MLDVFDDTEHLSWAKTYVFAVDDAPLRGFASAGVGLRKHNFFRYVFQKLRWNWFTLFCQLSPSSWLSPPYSNGWWIVAAFGGLDAIFVSHFPTHFWAYRRRTCIWCDTCADKKKTNAFSEIATDEAMMICWIFAYNKSQIESMYLSGASPRFLSTCSNISYNVVVISYPTRGRSWSNRSINGPNKWHT